MADPEKDPSGSPKPTWINNLAQRSTGLPGNDPPPKPKAPGDSNLWALAGLGFQFAASTVIFALVGVYIDKRTGWSPWGVVVLVFLALIGNLYLLIKQGLTNEKPPTKRDPNAGSHPPDRGP